MSEQRRDRVFVSYSHKDRDWLERFSSVLAPDIRNGRVDYWDDRDLVPGDSWYERILESIRMAKVAVLLVSPNFLASRFIMEEELPRILEARNDGLTIVWVPLAGKFYGPDAPPELRPLAEIQAAFDAGRPLCECEQATQTGMLIDLCNHINRLLNPSRVPSNLPFTSLASLFKGRGEALAQIDRCIRQHGSAAITQPQAIHGLGGIGKTRLAIEFAWQHKADFTAFLFVSANTPDDLDRNLAALCRPDCLYLVESRSLDQGEQRDAVVRWLQQNKNWLLILDNVDTDEGVRAVKGLVAKLRGGHILITSRITQWGRSVHSFALDVLGIEDAVDLLLESVHAWRDPKPEDAVQARELADRLGRLPLSLTHAAAYMERHHQTFDRYLDDFNSRFDRVLSFHDHVAIEYETELDQDSMQGVTVEMNALRKTHVKTVATTFFLSFDRLTPESKAILQASSFLSPDPIPVAMFEGCPNEVGSAVALWCEETGETSAGQDLTDAIADLSRYSLITRAGETFSVHRMQQRILRYRIPRDHVPRWSEKTRSVLCKYAPTETAESPRTWPLWDVLRPHAEILVNGFLTDDRIEPYHELMTDLGCLYFGKALYKLSLAMDKDAIELIRRTDGPESKRMASKLLACGESLRVLGQAEEALAKFNESLEIRKKLYGEKNDEVATILNYIGLAHGNLYNNKDAEDYYRRAIEIYESLGDEADRQGYAKALGNLAGLIDRPDNHEEAEKFFSKAVELTEDHEGSHVKPQLAIICRAELANLLMEKGNVAAADNLCRDILDRLNLFPEEHPFREQVLERYAWMLRQSHRLREAKEQFSAAVLAKRQQWGKDGTGNQPARRLRSKLRIVETTMSHGCSPAIDSAGLAEFRAEVEPAGKEGWQPAMVKGIRVLDIENLSIDFIMDQGSENDEKQQQNERTQLFINFFLTSIAVDEENQWASASGEMPPELQSTRLGAELVEAGKALGRFVLYALHRDTASGAAFADALSQAGFGAGLEVSNPSLELWVASVGGSVYTGKDLGPWVVDKEEGDAQAVVLEAPLGVFWEWHAGLGSGVECSRGLIHALDAAFKTHILPLIEKSMQEGRLLSRFRAISHVILIARWFKEHYQNHPRVAGFLETGNPEQLSPTIKNISSHSGPAGQDGIGISVTETRAVHLAKAVDLNNKALELRKLGRFDEAEPLLREALSIDEEIRGPGEPKIAHRLNNLSTVLVLKGNFAEAKAHLARAWSIKQSTGHDITSPRILWMQLLIGLMENQPTNSYVGQMKSLLSGSPLGDLAHVVETWDISYILNFLQPKLGTRYMEFLGAILCTLNGRSSITELDRFPEWSDWPSVSLNQPLG